MYLMYCTRPDIAFALEMLSKNSSNPGKEQWSALTRVLKKGSYELAKR